MNDLSLDVLRAGQSNKIVITVEEVKAVAAQDLLDAARHFVTHAGPVQKIRQAHHEIARLIAAGHSNVETARITGRTKEGIQVLLRSPAFQELVAYYQEVRTQDAYEFENRIKMAASNGLDELADRLEDQEAVKVMPTKELYQVTTGLLDRAGHSPVSRRESRNFNFGFTGEDIRKLKDEAKQKEIEGEFEDVTDSFDGSALPSS